MVTQDSDYLTLLAQGAARVADDVAAMDAVAVSALSHRPAMRAVKALVVAFCAPGSPYRHVPSILEPAGALLRQLESAQLPSGLFDNENLASPPDTCFTVNDGFLVLDVARSAPHDLLAPIEAAVRGLVAGTADSLLVGGVHTPNHRWELTAALLRLHRMLGDARLRTRAEQWLAEGIDIDQDGLYSERSPNYAAYVSNPSMLTIADELDDERYRNIVRRNLEATLVLLEDDLTVETVQSRRQDQGSAFSAQPYLSQFREFAVRDADGRFAEIAERLIAAGVADPVAALAEALTRPLVAARLPVAAPALATGRTLFADARLARVRTRELSASVYAGSDVPATRRVASGLSNSAVLVRARSNGVIVRSVRMSHDFFALGPFRPEEMDVLDDGRFVLSARAAAGYHQPLTAADLHEDGAYALTSEGRFFAAMSFDRRPTTAMELATTAVVEIGERHFEIGFTFEGPRTTWTAEIVLAPGGEFAGTLPLPGGRLLVEGHAQYRVGETLLTIGPGAGAGDGRPVAYDPGELVDYVGGADTIDGERLLVTGHTDTPYTLRLSFDG